MVGYHTPWYQRCCLIVYGCLLCGILGGCAWFQARPQQEIPLEERPYVAVLPIGIKVEITQLSDLRAQVGADLVLVGNILDYGKIRWQYWVPGLVASMLAETLIVGAATGFNPALMAATAGSELLTDVPFWWGGAYIGGWAFR